MSRRSAASIERGKPHPYVEDPETPGCCQRCRRIEANDMHVDGYPTVDPAVSEAERQRLGERDL